jgi:hypothetical protein
MTNKCVQELVGFINVFEIYPNMFRQVVAIFRGVVGGLEDNQVISVFFANTTTFPLWTSWSPLPVVAEV